MVKSAEATAFEAFRRLSKLHLQFLFDEYGFAVAEAEMHLPDMWIKYRNTTTQVAVRFEYGSELWVTVGRLSVVASHVVGGEQYNLDVLLSLRAPELELEEGRLLDFDETRVSEILANRAAALRHADDILRGDFAIFPELARIAEERFQQKMAKVKSL